MRANAAALRSGTTAGSGPARDDAALPTASPSTSATTFSRLRPAGAADAMRNAR
jgi:hypothetical protein